MWLLIFQGALLSQDIHTQEKGFLRYVQYRNNYRKYTLYSKRKGGATNISPIESVSTEINNFDWYSFRIAIISASVCTPCSNCCQAPTSVPYLPLQLVHSVHC